MHQPTALYPAIVDYLDVTLAPAVALRDFLDVIPTKHVERVQTTPSETPHRVTVVLLETATPNAVEEIRAAIAPLVAEEPDLRRGNVGTVFVPERPGTSSDAAQA